MFSIIIPVYRNEASLAELVASLAVIARDIAARFERSTEVVFVVDGSPDDSYPALRRILPSAPFRSRLLLHTRNFGAFAAIRSGLAAAGGELFAVMAADLQEPPELMLEFLGALDSDECDVVVGSRRERSDPLANRIASKLFWRLYRRWVIPDIPKGGVDVFGCNRRFRDELVKLEESNSSLVGLLFWLGFRRKEILYDRRERTQGRSAWTFTKKLTYFFDSVFSFTDLPIRLLICFGLLGLVTSIVVGLTVFSLRILGLVDVPGYTATVLIVLFFGGLNALGLGIVGTYAWRGFENTKHRPLALVMKQDTFDGRKPIEIERGMSELRQ